jgi:hypothetical protein
MQDQRNTPNSVARGPLSGSDARLVEELLGLRRWSLLEGLLAWREAS